MYVYVALRGKQLHYICRKERSHYNREGWGIFRTVNQMCEPANTKASNVREVCYWYVDIDSGKKEEIMAALGQVPLRPTLIIETKNGYHAYWRAKRGRAKVENYSDIQRGIADRLKLLGVQCDRAVRNINRFLRQPGYMHCKDKNSPFLVKAVFRDTDLRYDDEIMSKYFPSARWGSSGDKAPIQGTIGIGLVLASEGGGRAYCPFKRHSSEENGCPAMLVNEDSNTAFCFACNRLYTSDEIKNADI